MTTDERSAHEQHLDHAEAVSAHFEDAIDTLPAHYTDQDLLAGLLFFTAAALGRCHQSLNGSPEALERMIAQLVEGIRIVVQLPKEM